jgi:predicted PurR-regulated permease PerM
MKVDEFFYTRAIYTALRIGFIALLLYWSFLILKPFLMLVLWGIIISVALFPIFKMLAKKLGGREKLSATIITVFLLAILIVPSIFLVSSTVESLSNIAREMEEGTLRIPPPEQSIAEWPVVGKPVYETWKLFSNNMTAAIEKFMPQIKEAAPKVLSLAAGLGSTLLLFIFSILIAGVLFTQHKGAERAARSIFNTLIGKQSENFVEFSAKIIRSVVQGILGIAMIQSLLSAIGMVAIGIPAAGLWALLVLFLAIVQLPPILILAPVAIYSFTITSTTPAVIFSIYLAIVSMSDAFLKPMLLGRGVDVPMLAVLLGAIGGMILSGIIGLFVGAVVLAITYKVFEALLVEDALEKELPENEKTSTNS